MLIKFIFLFHFMLGEENSITIFSSREIIKPKVSNLQITPSELEGPIGVQQRVLKSTAKQCRRLL